MKEKQILKYDVFNRTSAVGAIYMDIINLFVRLLRILGRRGR